MVRMMNQNHQNRSYAWVYNLHRSGAWRLLGMKHASGPAGFVPASERLRRPASRSLLVTRDSQERQEKLPDKVL